MNNELPISRMMNNHLTTVRYPLANGNGYTNFRSAQILLCNYFFCVGAECGQVKSKDDSASRLYSKDVPVGRLLDATDRSGDRSLLKSNNKKAALTGGFFLYNCI